MKSRTVRRHIRESFKSLSRNGWMTFASVSAVTVTLLLIGVFVIIMMNLNQLADNIENDVEIKVVAEQEATKEQVQELLKEVKETPGVAEVKYSSSEQELNQMIQSFGEEFALYKQDNPLGDALYIKADDPKKTASIAKEISTYKYTYDVEYGEGKVEKLFNVLKIGRNVGLILILALLFTAMFLISNTIRLTIVARRTEIDIMKLVGATDSFVRIPFMLEGVWLGIFGAVIPIALMTTFYSQLYTFWEGRLQNELFHLLDPSPFLLQLNGLLLFVAVFIGVWGSFMSVRKFLRS
ncbi:cell division protein FtsX [Sporosarcina sp. P37]|uniref:permease-like cell division protein FtsX n=1 Tax=unclassified Sporosarcina TaxID=2647733 RepID=UPI0009BD1480|nr:MULTISPECIES: permease-like cell division protein FtsX [unclassified Sporosarcina]ARD49087.1 cell division protein FtsX [Sporosarcina sp. P33]ARK25546.1 cell division protein FtsX [Sporosarcina sp. P37]PID17759.1 ABC transporter permease [Sporosarcina sp. P35]